MCKHVAEVGLREQWPHEGERQKYPQAFQGDAQSTTVPEPAEEGVIVVASTKGQHHGEEQSLFHPIEGQDAWDIK